MSNVSNNCHFQWMDEDEMIYHHCLRLKDSTHELHQCGCGATTANLPGAEAFEGTIKELIQNQFSHEMYNESKEIPSKPCPFCGRVATVPMTIRQFIEFYYDPDRRNIQEIFPELSKSERERLQTGICDFCWENVL